MFVVPLRVREVGHDGDRAIPSQRRTKSVSLCVCKWSKGEGGTAQEEVEAKLEDLD